MYHRHPILTVAIGILLLAQIAIAAVDAPVRPAAPRALVAGDGPAAPAFLLMTPANDAAFVREAIAGARQEIARSRAALAQSKRVDVRGVAQILTLDFADLDQAFTRLAKQKGWGLTASTKGRESTSDASARRDSEPFSDGRYIETQIAAHQARIETLHSQATYALEPEVRELAARTLWKLEQHLTQLQRLDH